MQLYEWRLWIWHFSVVVIFLTMSPMDSVLSCFLDSCLQTDGEHQIASLPQPTTAATLSPTVRLMLISAQSRTLVYSSVQCSTRTLTSDNSWRHSAERRQRLQVPGLKGQPNRVRWRIGMTGSNDGGLVWGWEDILTFHPSFLKEFSFTDPTLSATFLSGRACSLPSSHLPSSSSLGQFVSLEMEDYASVEMHL